MNNALKVYVRDLKRFARVPQAIIILIGIIIVPSLYAWFNIIAFWDPYSDTKAVKVAVVNMDEGAYSELTGEVNVGDQVVAQLKQNDQLGWQFMDEDAAMHAVKSGESYAAIVIPAQFSSDLLSVTTGDFTRPELEYYVNEKANAIAPKITGVGATTVQTQINSNFVSTVSETLTTTLEKAGVEINSHIENAQDQSLNALGTALSELETAQQQIAETGVALGNGESALADVRTALQDAQNAIDGAQTAISEVDGLVEDVQAGIISLSGSLTSSAIASSAKLAELSTKVNHQFSAATAGIDQASSVIASATADASAVVEANQRVLSELQGVLATLSPTDPQFQAITDTVAGLQERNAADQRLVDSLEALNAEVAQTNSELRTSAQAMRTDIDNITTSTAAIGTSTQNALPQLNQALSDLSATAGGLSSSLGAQKTLLVEAEQVVDSVEDVLTQAGAAATEMGSNLETFQQQLVALRADVGALQSADLWKQAQVLSNLDPKKIADFMAAPVTVQEKIVFPVATYGSAMAPLFTNLSLWIAAFVLVVLLKLEVDTEGVKGLTVRQAYLGRWMLLATINFFQALLVSVGNVVIGVQMASAVAYVCTSIFAGFVYMAIIYALAMSFGYVGKGMAILLVIMQIPGASGIYPIEMMPSFFKMLYPFFPFTYGIDAMRETIGGFYNGDYWRSFLVLLLFAVLAFALGLFFRQRLGNFARLFNSKLSMTGLFLSENVQVLGSRRRVTQLVQALTNRQKFREQTLRQAHWFEERHLTLLRVSLLVWATCTAVLVVVAGILPESRATVLGLWGVLCLVTIGFVVVLEYLKQNMRFAKTLGSLPAPELKMKLAHEENATHSDTTLDELRERV